MLIAAGMLLTASVAVTACGGSGGGGGRSGSASPAPTAGSSSSNPGAAAPVSVHAVGSVGRVLVDAKGDVLYSPDQEKSGTIRCTAACTAVWPPATVPAGTTVPHTVAGASGTLGTVHRQDGSVQLTFNGRPLYRFTVDKQPGRAAGDGAKDNFDHVAFSWHVIRVGGGATPSSPSAPAGGGNNGGY